MQNSRSSYSLTNQLIAWSIHCITASGACLGLLSLIAINRQQYFLAFCLMGGTLIIDSIDGTLARRAKIQSVLPQIDGTLLDNIVDYLNYVITPCFFLVMNPTLLPSQLILTIVIAIVLSSTYQFCQADAKTPDHFFKGFPCYWNLTVFYIFIFKLTALTNAIILLTLCVLVFVPIKYVYPSRLDYLTRSPPLKKLMHCLSVIYALSSIILLLQYNAPSQITIFITISYIILYFMLSLYRTFIPLRSQIAL